MPEPVTARIIFDGPMPGGAQTGDLAGLMAEVQRLIAHLRLATDNRLAVSGPEAAKLIGICEDNLKMYGAPCVRIGNRRVYRVDGLRQWLESLEQQEQEAVTP